jgi:hypothetical protein
MKDYFLFFSDNKSGWKTNEKILSKKEPTIYDEVKKFAELHSLNHLKFQQQVWHFINKYPDIPKCAECNEILKFKKSLKEGYGKYCSLLCTNKNKNHIESSKKTWLSNKTEILDKIKKTTLEKFGVENVFQDKELIKQGFNKKYNVDNVWEIEGINDKRKQSYLTKYGYNSNLNNKDTHTKTIDTKQKNFLSKYPNFTFKNYTGKTLTLNCESCSQEYNIDRSSFRHRVLHNITPCTICNPINSGESFFEKEILTFVKEIYNGFVVENDRNIINPKELDILIPDKKLAIEFNGLFWHSSEFVGYKYHLDKTNLCKIKGVDLIHIFEDEWFHKKDIVKSIIKSKLKIYDRVIYARKCKIVELSSKLYKDFCNENHIQGHVNSSIKLGLYLDDVLISVMSFGGLRKSLGSNSEEGTYEMLRYCSKLNTLVIGGASKLFSYFIKKYNPHKIISFSDKRYFIGDLYEKLKFVMDKETSPNYYYVTDYLKRENRFKYRKDILVKQGFDSEKSEFNIMDERGIHRIYDCGNKKWVWRK